MNRCGLGTFNELAGRTHRGNCLRGRAESLSAICSTLTSVQHRQQNLTAARFTIRQYTQTVIRRSLHVSTQSSYQQSPGESRPRGTEAEDYRRSAAPPPPPPPPPPRQKASRGFPLWGTIIAVLVAGGLWWGYIDSQVPEVYRDKDGMQYMLTKAGNQVLVGEDNDGRVYFIDKAGNFYYDSGDANVGIYVVTADDLVYNLFDDGSGERQQVYVGTFEDLKTQKVAALGGVPVEKLRQAMEGFDGTVTGFDVPATGDDAPSGRDFADSPVPTGIIEYDPELVLEGKERR